MARTAELSDGRVLPSEAMPEVVPGQQISFDEAVELDADTHPGELVGGRWQPVTRNTWRHGTIASNVVFLLMAWVKAAGGGWSVATGDPGTKLKNDTLRGPDVGVVRAERAPAGTGTDGWLEGAPDLAVEVAGDSQGIAELTLKVVDYLKAGAQLVWVVDPRARKVLVHTPTGPVRVLSEADTLDAEPVLPGFSCQVAELFE